MSRGVGAKRGRGRQVETSDSMMGCIALELVEPSANLRKRFDTVLGNMSTQRGMRPELRQAMDEALQNINVEVQWTVKGIKGKSIIIIIPLAAAYLILLPLNPPKHSKGDSNRKRSYKSCKGAGRPL